MINVFTLIEKRQGRYLFENTTVLGQELELEWNCLVSEQIKLHNEKKPSNNVFLNDIKFDMLNIINSGKKNACFYVYYLYELNLKLVYIDTDKIPNGKTVSDIMKFAVSDKIHNDELYWERKEEVRQKSEYSVKKSTKSLTFKEETSIISKSNYSDMNDVKKVVFKKDCSLFTSKKSDVFNKSVKELFNSLYEKRVSNDFFNLFKIIDNKYTEDYYYHTLDKVDLGHTFIYKDNVMYSPIDGNIIKILNKEI